MNKSGRFIGKICGLPWEISLSREREKSAEAIVPHLREGQNLQVRKQ